MIYIVEVPHQRKAFCWSVHDKSTFVDLVNDLYPNKEYCESFDDAVQIVGEDLNNLFIFESETEAHNFLLNADSMAFHQKHFALKALAVELSKNGSEFNNVN